MKVKILLIAFLSIVYLQANAQKSNDEVTLVVSATASTEDEAIKTALRSAIEQTYGTFVSANTTLLNDELVKDEIVTISSGNIKEYNKIESYENTNGQISVVLKVTVCISKLVTYAKNKGASTEFAGASFAMNMKMLELNKEAEEKALINLLLFIKESLPSAFDRNIQTINPSIPRRFEFYGPGSGRAFFPDPNDNNDSYMNLNKEDINWAHNVAEKCYEMSILISYVNNNNTEPFISYVKNYLRSISLTQDEREYLEKTGIDFSGYNFYFLNYPTEDDFDDLNSANHYYFRNGSDVIGSFTCQLAKIFDKYFFNFYVVDNLGGRSLVDYHTKMDDLYGEEFRNYSSGVLSPKSFFASLVYYYNETKFQLVPDGSIKLTFFIPKDKIAQYSSFTIE